MPPPLGPQNAMATIRLEIPSSVSVSRTRKALVQVGGQADLGGQLDA
ncbi:hypothetical protein [Proteus faecis]